MSLRVLTSALALVAFALFAPSVALADDGGTDADVDGAVDAATDASLDGSTDAATDAAKDAAVDAPVTSDGSATTTRPDSGEELPDSGTAVTPTDDGGGCNSAGDAMAAGWPLVLVLAALARRRRS